MHIPSVFVALVYLSWYGFFVFAAFCLGQGIYYLASLAEEYTQATKKILRVATYVILVLHALLLVFERLPLVQIGIGVLAHCSYLVQLKAFPNVKIVSVPFLTACTLFITDNIAWFLYFQSDVELFYRYRVLPAPAIAGFYFSAVWLVPFGLFISLSINEAVLPSAGFSKAFGRGENTSHPRSFPTDNMSSAAMTHARTGVAAPDGVSFAVDTQIHGKGFAGKQRGHTD